MGPWSHGGIVDQSVGKDSSFDQPKHSMAFINRCCDHTPSSKSDSAPGQTPAQNLVQHNQHELPALAAEADANGRTSQHNGDDDDDVDRRQAWGSQTSLAGGQASGRSEQSTRSKQASKAEEDAASPSIHFFMMGCESHRGWRACHSWPPPDASAPPLKLYLSKAAGPAPRKTRSWFWRSKKKVQDPTGESAASEPDPQPVTTQQAPDQGTLPESLNRQPKPSQESISGHGQSQRQQAGEQEQSHEELNPAPVPAQQGQTRVTQVVASKQHPQLGLLSNRPGGQNCRFRHEVGLDKHPKVCFCPCIKT